MRIILLLIVLFFAIQTSWGQQKPSDLEREFYYIEDTINLNKLKSKKIKIKSIVNKNVKISRTNTYFIEYDFIKGVYLRNNIKPRVNHPIVFKINNINKLAYDIKITTTDSIIANSYSLINPILSELLIKSDNKQTSTATVNLNESISSINKNDIKIDTMQSKGKEEVKHIIDELYKIPLLNDQINILKVMNDSLNDVRELVFQLQDKAEKEVEDLNFMKTQFANDNNYLRINKDSNVIEKDTASFNKNRLNLITMINNIESALSESETKMDNLQVRLNITNERLTNLSNITNRGLKKFAEDNKVYLSQYKTLIDNYKNITILLNNHKQLLNIVQIKDLTLEEFNKKYKNIIERIRVVVENAHSTISTFNEEYNAFKLQYTYIKYNPDIDTIFNFGGKIKLYAHVETVKTNVENMNNIFNSLNFDEIITYMSDCISAIENEKNYYIISDPIQPKNDVIYFNISLTKKSGVDANKKRTFNHSEYLRRGIRIDLGLGLAGAFFPKVKSYELSRNQDSLLLYRKSKHTYIPSVIGIATVGFRSAGYCMFGLSAGMGLDINEGEIQLSNFYAGPSLTIGKYDRVTIAGGASIKNVDILKQGNYVGKNYDLGTTLETISNKRYEIGLFMSVSYNLTKGMKETIKYLKLLP